MENSFQYLFQLNFTPDTLGCYGFSYMGMSVNDTYGYEGMTQQTG